MISAALLAVTLVATPAADKPPLKLAVPAWSVVNIKADLASFYADALAQALRSKGVKVVTSQDIATLLGMERQKQLLGCDDGGASCLAELGSALGCDGTLVASVAKLDDAFRGTVRVLSARDGSVLTETTLAASSEKQLLERLDDVAEVLAAALTGEAKPAASAPRLRGVTWAPAALGGVALAGAGVGFAVASGEYNALATSPDFAQGQRHAEAGKRAQGLAWAGVAVGAAALGTAVVFFLSGDDAPQVTPSVSVTPAGAAVSVGGVW